MAIDALRLALDGEADKALAAIETLPEKRGLAADFQARLAHVHALVSLDRAQEARALLQAAREEDRTWLDAVIRLEGPASTLARSVMRPARARGKATRVSAQTTMKPMPRPKATSPARRAPGTSLAPTARPTRTDAAALIPSGTMKVAVTSVITT